MIKKYLLTILFSVFTINAQAQNNSYISITENVKIEKTIQTKTISNKTYKIVNMITPVQNDYEIATLYMNCNTEKYKIENITYYNKDNIPMFVFSKNNNTDELTFYNFKMSDIIDKISKYACYT